MLTGLKVSSIPGADVTTLYVASGEIVTNFVSVNNGHVLLELLFWTKGLLATEIFIGNTTLMTNTGLRLVVEKSLTACCS